MPDMMPGNKYSLWNPHMYFIPAQYILDLNYVHVSYTGAQTKEAGMIKPEHLSFLKEKACKQI